MNSAGYLLARLPAGARVLDVGCGPGTITVDLAARVPGGEVTGIDAAPDVLAEARQEAERRGQANVRFEGGDAYRLAYAMGRMDVGRVTTSLYLVPAAAIVIALVWLGQTPGPLELAGGAIALAGVILAGSSGRRSRPHPPPPRPRAGSQVAEVGEPMSVR